jgi:hypothetical protein
MQDDSPRIQYYLFLQLYAGRRGSECIGASAGLAKIGPIADWSISRESNRFPKSIQIDSDIKYV